MDTSNNVSENIRRIREQKGLKQTDIAKALGMDAPNYHRLEKKDSRLTIDQLKSIANALEVSIFQLLGTDNETLPIEVFDEILNKYPGRDTDWVRFNMSAITTATILLADQLGIGNLRHLDSTGTIFRVPVKDLSKGQKSDLMHKGWTRELTDEHKLEIQSIMMALSNSINSFDGFK